MTSTAQSTILLLACRLPFSSAVLGRPAERHLRRLLAAYRSTDDTQALGQAVDFLDKLLHLRPSFGGLGGVHSEGRIRVEIGGWAADPSRRRRVENVLVLLDAAVIASTRPRHPRLDVAKAFSDSTFLRTGFKAGGIVLHSLQSVALLRALVTWREGGASLLRLASELRPAHRCFDGPVPDSVQWRGRTLAIDADPCGYLDNVVLARHVPLFYATLVDSALETGDWGLFDLALIAGRTDLARTIVEAASSDGLCPAEIMARKWFDFGDDEAARRCASKWAEDAPGPHRVAGVFNVRRLDLETGDGARFRRVHAAEELKVELPEVLDRRPSGTGSIRLRVPPLGVHAVGAARLVRGATVIADDSLLVDDPAALPALDFIAGTWDHVHGSPLRLDRALVLADHDDSRRVQQGILVAGRSAFNYFHFIVEYLPRLLLAEALPALAGVPALVTDDIAPTSLEALRLIAGDRPVSMHGRRTLLEVDALYLPSLHTCVRDTTQLPWIHGARYSPTLLRLFRARVLAAARPDSAMHRRIFLMRKSGARQMGNADQIAEIAARRDFELVDPGALTFLEQVRTFAEADVIVGAGGAAFTNLLFARPGARVLGLIARQLDDFCMHAEIARFAGARFAYLTGPSSRSPRAFATRRDYMHDDFSVDTGRFAQALEAIDG